MTTGGVRKIHWSSDVIRGVIFKYYRGKKWNTSNRGVLIVLDQTKIEKVHRRLHVCYHQLETSPMRRDF